MERLVSLFLYTYLFNSVKNKILKRQSKQQTYLFITESYDFLQVNINLTNPKMHIVANTQQLKIFSIQNILYQRRMNLRNNLFEWSKGS